MNLLGEVVQWDLVPDFAINKYLHANFWTKYFTGGDPIFLCLYHRTNGSPRVWRLFKNVGVYLGASP